jgi:hypothetical protein
MRRLKAVKEHINIVTDVSIWADDGGVSSRELEKSGQNQQKKINYENENCFRNRSIN